MTLREYILTYSVNDNIVANLFDYYDIFISTLNDSFKKYSYHTSNLVLCYFKDHEDINPSMGWIKDKKLKGVKVCHCFGCGKTADVVRLHQILSKQYLNKELSEQEACYEIADLFSIPLGDFEELDEEDYEEMYMRNLRRIDSLKNRYSVRDWERGIMDIRSNSKMGAVDLNKLNSESVKMIATVKQLYD